MVCQYDFELASNGPQHHEVQQQESAAPLLISLSADDQDSFSWNTAVGDLFEQGDHPGDFANISISRYFGDASATPGTWGLHGLETRQSCAMPQSIRCEHRPEPSFTVC